MARSYANVATAIWRDDDFLALTVDEQYVYFLLVSQPDISAAGVLTVALTRWASRSKGMTRERLLAAIDGLQAHRFVVVDYDTDELLVRSFVRWDGGYTNSKRRFAIRDAAVQVVSSALCRALAAEFARLDLPAEWVPVSSQDGLSMGYPDFQDGLSMGYPDSRDGLSTPALSHNTDPPPELDLPSEQVPVFPQVDSLSIAHTEKEDGLSENPGWATPKNSDTRRVVGTKALEVVPATHNPQPTTPVPSHNADPPASGRKRGTRLPDDFAITPEMVTWARERVPKVDGRHETEKFINHWRGETGKSATKLDWAAAWRNWMLRASERPAPAFTGANRHTRQRHDNPFAEQP